MDLSIIVVNWNTRELLQRCLEAVQATVEGLRYEIWVVDNGSQDGSAEMVGKQFPGTRLIANSENAGFARANNQALRLCQGRYALLLNSDAFLQAGTAQRLVETLEADNRAGIGGPRLVYPDGREQRSHGRLPSLGSEVLSMLGLDKLNLAASTRGSCRKVMETGMVSGACLLARKAMLDEIGLLDERFFMFSEEVDLCARAHAAGWKVLHVGDALAVHVGGGSGAFNTQRILDLYRSKIQYFEKHYGLITARWLFVAMWAISRLKAAFFGLWNRPQAHIWREVTRELK
jgi:GT2 family glycosyltransferase